MFGLLVTGQLRDVERDDAFALERTDNDLLTLDVMRQHRRHQIGQHRLQQEAGLLYDASLGFSEHDGFRYSYCWPHKFFDFDKQQITDLWEIPLTLMDVTHFYKRELDFEQSRESVKMLAGEVERFNGVFYLLWHNSFFNESFK